MLVLCVCEVNRRLQEAASIDNDIRSKYSQYNQVKNTLATLQRKQMWAFFFFFFDSFTLKLRLLTVVSR